MNKEFILLTTKEGTPIIIGVSNISKIQPEESENGTGSVITFNFSRNSDLSFAIAIVAESFEDVKSMIGL